MIVSQHYLSRRSAEEAGPHSPAPSRERVGKTRKGSGGAKILREREAGRKERERNLCDVRSGACLVDTVGSWAWMGWFVGSVSSVTCRAFLPPASAVRDYCYLLEKESLLLCLVGEDPSVGRSVGGDGYGSAIQDRPE